MALAHKQLVEVGRYLMAARREEAPRLSMIHDYLANLVLDIYVPKAATDEYRSLVDQARFNILPLLVSSVANNLFIDGYRTGKASRENAPIWDKGWQANRMDARQAGIWRAALSYGYSYARVLPGVLNNEAAPKITPFSPRRMTTLYDDPINDEWPRYAMSVNPPRIAGGARVVDVEILDEENAYRFTLPAGMAALPGYRDRVEPMTGGFTIDPQRLTVVAHNLGVTPVVRFCADRNDLDDGAIGVVEPMIPAQRQLNQTTFGLLMAQQYAAFKQRWVTGMAIPEDENGNPVEPWNAAVNRVWIAEDEDTKFGEFGETPLDGYLNSRDKTLLYISSVRQIPPHTMVVGNAVSNISAEALAALESGHQQDIAERRTSLGEDAEQMLRLAGKAMGDDTAWADTSAAVRWRDTVPRSLAQLADAYGKLATMLGVPPQALWERLPDVTDDDLKEWKKLAKENDSIAKLGGLLNGQTGGRAAAGASPAAGGGNRPGGSGRDRAPGAASANR